MCDRRAERSAGAVVVLALAACAAPSPAPPQWQRGASEMQASRHGSWCNVTLRGGRVVSGELLAVDTQSAYVGLDPYVLRLPSRCVDSISIAAFEAPLGGMAAMGALGALSAMTHGVFAVFSLPVWVAVSVSTARGLSQTGHEVHRASGAFPFEGARRWARFPQGLPAGFAARIPQKLTVDGRCEVVPAEPPAGAVSPAEVRP